MKKNYLFSFLFGFTLPILIYSQNPLDFVPKNIVEYTEANKLIAEAYAPRFLHQIDGIYEEEPISGDCIEVDYDPTGVRDFITAFDFDGDWIMDNNWENLYCILNNSPTVAEMQSMDELKPHVYYMVTWLEEEWVITYTLFHPVDWNDCQGIPFYDNIDKHENDTEAGIVYVSRSDFNVSHVKTIYHNGTKSTSNPIFASPNKVIFEVDDETHSIVPFGIPANGTLPESGCHTGFDYHLTYDFANGAEPSLDLTDDLNFRSGLYKLVDIFEPGGLWARRNDPQTMTFDGKLVGDNGLGNNKARAPWNWPALPLRYPGPSHCNQSSFIEYDPFEGCGNSIFEEFPPCPTNTLPFEPFERLVFRIKNDVVLEDYDMNYGNMLIESGANVIIKNSNLTFIGKLQLAEGASLTIDNSTLSGCGLPISDNWQGIVFKESGLYSNEHSTTTIKVKNNSIISDAINGIYVKVPYDRPTTVSISASDASFLNNERGITVFDNKDCILDFNIDKSIFKENQKGINLFGVDFVNVSTSQFTDNDYGINLHDSYLRLTNQNNFVSNIFGVYSRGSVPLSGGFLVGHQDEPHNTFVKNKVNVVAQANSHPLGSDIVNNLFDNTYSPVDISGGSIPVSTMIYGDTRSEFLYNTTIFTGIGTSIYANGENNNKVGCNRYIETYYSDIEVRFENKETEFLQNSFESTLASVGNIKLFQAEIGEQQGIPGNPAGNCFNEEELSKLVSEDFIGESTYFYKDEGITSCHYPGIESELTLNGSQEDPRHCIEDQIGIFSVAPPPPIGNDLFHEFLQPVIISPDSINCKICIKQEALTLIQQIISNSGDNPYTYASEPDLNPNINYILYEQLDDAIHRGLELAINDNDVTYGEELLLPLKGWYHQIRLYGLYVILQEYTKAYTLNNTLQPQNQNEIAFIEVQNINLESLTNENFEPSSSQLIKLEEVADSHLPAAGYARSIYYNLTGIDLPILFYDNRYQPVIRNDDQAGNMVNIYPNPAKSNLQIETEYNISEVKLINIHGQEVLNHRKRISSNTTSIDVSNYSKGMYLIIVKMENGTIANSKIILK